MLRLGWSLAFALVLLSVPASSADTTLQAVPPPCEPRAAEESITIQRVGASAEAGPFTFYAITTGSRTLGQSNVEIWEENNDLAGLQNWPGECGRAADTFVLSTCVYRAGVFGALECPALTTSDLRETADEWIADLGL